MKPASPQGVIFSVAPKDSQAEKVVKPAAVRSDLDYIGFLENLVKGYALGHVLPELSPGPTV